MPVYERGYQHWQPSGRRAAPPWWVIARRGILEPLRSRWFLALLFLSCVPAVVKGVMLYFSYRAGRLAELIGHGVVAVRGFGLWAGVDIEPALATGKEISLRLADRGVLVKDTHGSTLRFAPPLVITAQEIDWAVQQFAAVLREAAA